ncbi:MAG: signal transduction histidine kinase, partial [bacterium]
YEFIKLHYGKMWIESQEEKGTHVFFQIPKQFPSESREVTNI